MAYNAKMLYKKNYSFTNQNPLISIKKRPEFGKVKEKNIVFHG